MNTPLKAMFLLLSSFSHIFTHHFDSFASYPWGLRNKAFLLGSYMDFNGTLDKLLLGVLYDTLTTIVCAIVFIVVQHAKNSCPKTICNFQEQVNSIYHKYSEKQH